jgi:hypothetical protein
MHLFKYHFQPLSLSVWQVYKMTEIGLLPPADVRYTPMDKGSSSISARQISMDLATQIFPPKGAAAQDVKLIDVHPATLKTDQTARFHTAMENRVIVLTNTLQTHAAQPSIEGATSAPEVELHALQNLAMHRSTRSEGTEALQTELDRTNAMDFTNFRREKKIVNRKANRQDKKILREHRSQQQNRKSNQRSRYQKNLEAHAKEFTKTHDSWSSQQQRIHKMALQHHAARDRDATKKMALDETERIRKLKANDEEGYMRLLHETKNERLLEMIRVTDSALDSLGTKLRAHKADLEKSSMADRPDAATAESEDTADAAAVKYKNVRIHAVFCDGMLGLILFWGRCTPIY